MLVARTASARQIRSQLGEERALRVQLLDDRLDHEVAPGQVGELGRRDEAGDRGVALVLRALALLDLAGQEVADATGRRLAELRGDLAPDDLEAGLDRDLRDAGTHGAQPDDPDPLHRHPGRGAYTGVGRC